LLLAAGSAERPDVASVRKAADVLGLLPKALVVGGAVALALRGARWTRWIARSVLPLAGMAAVFAIAYGVVQRASARGAATLAPSAGAAAGRLGRTNEPAPAAADVAEPMTTSAAIEPLQPVHAPVAPRATGTRAPIHAIAPVESADSLREQAALLDRSRARVAVGDTAGALALLDDYDRRFAGASLSEESNLIRIEALVRRGDKGAASVLARRFLGAYPGSVHVERVSALLHSLSP
jgi:hypothetical protein